MRKLLPFFVSVLLLSTLLQACGGDDSAPGAETPRASPSGTVNIDFWHSEVASNMEAIDRLVARFNASQDEVRARALFQGNYEESMAKLVASFRSGQVPALVFLGEAQAQKLIDSGRVTPVQEFIDREDYDLSDLDDKAARCYDVEGQIWAMPFTSELPLLYYNKTVFREVGLDPERPPQDLEELRQYSEKILKRDSSGTLQRSGLAIDVKNWLERVLATHGDPFVDNNNGRDGRATRVLFDGDTGRWFFRWWHDMVDEGLAINVGRNLAYVDGFLAMATGRAAMTFAYSGALRSVVDALEAGVEGAEGVEIGIGPLPGAPGSENHTVLSCYGLWVLNQRSPQEQEAAWKLIRWLMEPEQQAEWFAGSGYLPASRTAVERPAARDIVARYPLFQEALDLYSETPATPTTVSVVLGPFEEVSQVVLRSVEQMLDGAKEPEQAIEDAAREADGIIEDYNGSVAD